MHADADNFIACVRLTLAVVYFPTVVGGGGGVGGVRARGVGGRGRSTISTCCHSHHREEAETNAPRYSSGWGPLGLPGTCRHQQPPTATGDQLFLTGFTVESNLQLLCCGRCRIQLSSSSCAYGRLSQTGKEVLFKRRLTTADSRPAMIPELFFFFSYPHARMLWLTELEHSQVRFCSQSD